MLAKICLAIVTFLAAAFPLFATTTTTDMVFFIATDNHIHEYFNPSTGWSALDVTAAASAPSPASTSPLASVAVFEGTNPATFHVFFLEANGDIGEVHFDGTFWGYTNDTISANAPVAVTASALAVSNTQTAQYEIFYQAANGHIYEILFDGALFGATDVTAALPPGQIPATASGSPLTGTSNALYCVDVNHQIDVLRFQSGAWTGKVLGGQPFVPPAGGMAGFINLQEQDDLDITYVNSGNSMQNFIQENGTTWVANTLPGYPASALPFSIMESTGTFDGEDAFYIGTDSTVDEIHQVKTSFTKSKPSVLAGAPNATPSGTPAVIAFASVGTRVYYAGPDNHVILLFGNDGGTWYFTDLTTLLGGPTFSGGGRSQLTGLGR